MSLLAFIRDHLSSTIAFIRDHRFDAVYLLSSVIPVLAVTTFDIVGSTASINSEMITTSFHNFTKAFNLIKGSIGRDVPVSAICEIDLKKNLNLTHPLRVTLPDGWKRMEILAFGYTSIFVTQHVKKCELVQTFQKRYLTEPWNAQKLDMPSHQRFTNFLIMCSISSTLFLPPLKLSSVLCTAAIRPQVKIEASMHYRDGKNKYGTSTLFVRLKLPVLCEELWSFLRPVASLNSLLPDITMKADSASVLGQGDTAVGVDDSPDRSRPR